jgi:hypothetical protein
LLQDSDCQWEVFKVIRDNSKTVLMAMEALAGKQKSLRMKTMAGSNYTYTTSRYYYYCNNYMPVP